MNSIETPRDILGKMNLLQVAWQDALLDLICSQVFGGGRFGEKSETPCPRIV